VSRVRGKKREAANGKRERSVVMPALGGFLLGAATVLFILWLYSGPAVRPAAPRPVVPAAEATKETAGEAGPWYQAPAPVAPAPPPPGVLADLAERGLLVPVQGVGHSQLQDTFGDARGDGTRAHEALDIMAPRGTPVLAVEDGRIQKIFTSKQGGLTLYQFDPSETYCYYYAHLEGYADGLIGGQAVRKGQVLGYVGTTGNAPPNAPHLHFAIFRLTPEKQWWKGDPVNPYEVLRGLR